MRLVFCLASFCLVFTYASDTILLNDKKSHGIPFFPSLKKVKTMFSAAPNLKQSVLTMVSESRGRRVGATAKISQELWDECVTSKFQFVTMSEFEKDMAWVAKTTSRILAEADGKACFLTQGGIKRDFSGSYSGKSGDWMLSILQKDHLKQLPCIINFQMGEAPFAKEASRLEAALNEGYHTFIIIDDGAYSGKQITLMESQLRRNVPLHKVRTHFVIPYVSPYAAARIKTQSPSAVLHFKQEMPMMKCAALASVISPKLPLFAFEHKVPDEESLDQVIARQLTMFMKAYAGRQPWPPYKKFEPKRKTAKSPQRISPTTSASSSTHGLTRKPSLSRKKSS